MPFTPYHFGPSGFIGLLFRKWVDIPVFVLANVIVDVEVLVIVLFKLGYPVHRYCHTLLIGGIVGAVWGAAAYPLRNLFEKTMRIFRLNYEPTLRKMILSGILGVWLHVLLDGAQHADMRIFWPNTTFSLWKLVYRHLGNHSIEDACVVVFLLAGVTYLFATRSFASDDAGRTQATSNTKAK